MKLKKKTCDQQRHDNVRKLIEDDGGKFEYELKKNKDKKRKRTQIKEKIQICS